MQLALLVSVAAATTTTTRAEASSPVEKVVKLLTDMQHTLQQEAEADQEAFEKLSCWCETNDKGKTAAIAEYEAKVEELQSEIEGREKKAGRLADEIKKTSAEIAQHQESIDAGEAQRAKDGEKNHDEEVDLTQNIASLKGAIIVLKKHQATAFPQMHLDFLSLTTAKSLRRPDDLDKLSSWMGQRGFESLDRAQTKDIEQAVGGYLSSRGKSSVGRYSSAELSELAKAKKLVQAFALTQTDRGHVEGYQSQSGEIFGILTQLKEQLEQDLKDVQEKEGRQSGQSADLLANLKVQLDESEKRLADKETQAADNAKALVDAKGELVDTENNLDSDSKFLVELKKLCKQSDEEWAVRSNSARR